MYSRKYLTLKETCGYLGIGRNLALKLCQERTHGFPAVKIGNRYQIDAVKLAAWHDRWYAGEFDINT